MSQLYPRAQFLLEHRRYQDAEAELRQAIARDPEDGTARALLAIALSLQDRQQDALSEARLATTWRVEYSVADSAAMGDRTLEAN